MQKQELETVTARQYARLIALGFDWQYPDVVKDDRGYFVDWVYPSVSLALKWFRDVKKIHWAILAETESNARYGTYSIEYYFWFYPIYGASKAKTKRFGNYETAESALLDALLDYAEEQK